MKTHIILISDSKKNWYRHFIFTINFIFFLFLLILVLIVILKIFDFILNNSWSWVNPYLGFRKTYFSAYATNDDDLTHPNANKDKKDSEGIFSKIWKGIRWILSPILSFGKENKEKIKKTDTDTDTDPNFNFNPYLNPDEYFEEKKKKNIFSKTWGWIKSWFINSKPMEYKYKKENSDLKKDLGEDKSSLGKDNFQMKNEENSKTSEKEAEEELIKPEPEENKSPRPQSPQPVIQSTSNLEDDDNFIDKIQNKIFGKIWKIEKNLKLDLDNLDDDLFFILENNFNHKDDFDEHAAAIIYKTEGFVGFCKKNNYPKEKITAELKNILADMIARDIMDSLEFELRVDLYLESIFTNIPDVPYKTHGKFIKGYTLNEFKEYQQKIKQVEKTNIEEIKRINKTYYMLINAYLRDLDRMPNKKVLARKNARNAWFDDMENYTGEKLDSDEESIFNQFWSEEKYSEWFKGKIDKYSLTEDEINRSKRMFIDNYNEGYSIKRSFSQYELWKKQKKNNE